MLLGVLSCGSIDESDISPVEMDMVKSECLDPDGNCDDSGEPPVHPPCYPNCN